MMVSEVLCIQNGHEHYAEIAAHVYHSGIASNDHNVVKPSLVGFMLVARALNRGNCYCSASVD